MTYKTYIGAIAVFGFLITGLVIGAMAVNGQYQRSYDNQTIPHERIVVDTANKTPVEAAEYTNNFDPSVTVIAGGTELQGGGQDYTWYPATGNLSWNASSSSVSDGDMAEVTYSYDGRPLSIERTRDLRQMLFDVLPYVALMFTGLGLTGLFAGLYRYFKPKSSTRGR